ncbi:bacterioferritin [Vitiosangium sp. GDMCC 1.1324]|uniref:bacterioferritin n=1 Tax=Vitiosangium sp. (strain GDMCC 1.1324) TaxID=2138576 RepID=UPI000D346CFB|nr:bacterioferritin [Vitiosangium sp. GDMCC 1.1324]PTL82681.1 bacterioferritin [Vitiosangium sp. GDMCC 1.1324]
MKGHPQVIDLLNDVLTTELTAINEYFLHARIADNWGYDRLGKKIYEESIGEMKHADRIVKRILFLDGLPNLQRLGKVNVGETIPEMLRLDLDLELGSQRRLNDGIELCRSLGDNGSRELLEAILEDTEEHIDWLEAQLELMKQVGETNYLAQQIKKES